MTYLDSNVLVRIITGDDIATAERLLQIIDQAKKNDFYIDSTVLTEVCFVLEFHDYNMPRGSIASALKNILSAPQISSPKLAKTALHLYAKHTKLDFTDCWLIALAKDNADDILSLDKHFNKVFAV